MLAQRRPDEQVYVGPTSVSNVGPTESTTEKLRWPNVVMLSGQAAWIFVCLIKMAQVTLSELFEILIIAFTSAHFDQLDMISAYAKLLQKSG